MGICRRLCLVLALVLPILVSAVELKDDAPAEYTVKPGDTLWDIASMYLDSPWLWPELWRTNTQILNPHLIYPGDKLTLQENEEGEVELVVERVAKPKARFKLGPQGRKRQKESPIPLLVWSDVAPHLKGVSIIDKRAFDDLPYLLGDNEGTPRFGNDDWVLSKHSGQSEEKVWVVRQEQELNSPSGESIGIQVRKVSDAELGNQQLGTQQLIKVKGARLEARAGDRILTADPITPADFALTPATTERGQVIATLDQRQLIGKYDTVIINLGREHTKPGMVFGIYKQGPAILDGDTPDYDDNEVSSEFLAERIQQPALKSGELVVVKSYNGVSFALVTDSSSILKAGVYIGNP